MKYQATAIVSVHVGALVKLSKEQAARTVGLVEPVDKPAGWHRVLHPFQFKRGEEFETDMQFGKGSPFVAGDASDESKTSKADAGDDPKPRLLAKHKT